MWGFIECTRYYMSFDMPKVVLNEASLIVGTREKLGLLVAPGGGKSTIMRLLAGVDQPNGGRVVRDKGGIPLGYGGAIQPQLSGDQNARNVALLFGLDPYVFSAFCAEFSELGEPYFHPIKMWTGAMRAQLAFAMTYGLPASTYIADSRLAGGDRAFAQKCMVALHQRLESAGLIFITSAPRLTKEVCDRHAVLVHGKLIECGTHEEADELFSSITEEVAANVADEELASFDLA
ncbi:ABC-type polysaccharide/polyol phosphate transport system ATPase subunit [Sphingomonas sp. F9_3S_D5_B_2]